MLKGIIILSFGVIIGTFVGAFVYKMSCDWNLSYILRRNNYSSFNDIIKKWANFIDQLYDKIMNTLIKK
ncbi:MAG: hypothetical protein Q8888_00985 [Vigna little leaf phytoplasma]|nr:hypothetical protein [Vigna little leaf phytoplasma]